MATPMSFLSFVASRSVASRSVVTRFRTGLALLLCLPLAAAAVAQDSIQEQLQVTLERGQAELAEEDFEAARATFSEAIQLASLFPQGYIGRAKAYVGLEQYDKAIEDFKAAQDRSQQVIPDLMHARGEMYVQLGQQFFGVALSDLQAAYDAEPDNRDYMLSLGLLLAKISGSDPNYGAKAEELLTEYLEGGPVESGDTEAEIYRLRGQAIAAQGKYAEGLEDLQRSLELEPDEYRTHFTIGTVYLQQEEYAEAAAAIAQAIASYVPEEEDDDTPYSQGYLTLAAVQQQLGAELTDPAAQQTAYRDSIETCNQLLDLAGDKPELAGVRAAMLFRRGVGQRLLGQHGAAVRSFTEAINLNPELAEAYFRRAICFRELGEEGLSTADLEAAQALNFEDPRVYLQQGLTLAQQGNYRDAIAAYNQAVSFSNRYVDAYLNRGLAYYQLGELERAIDNFNQCIRLEPNVGAHFVKRGITYLELGEVERAEQSFVNALMFDPHDLTALKALEQHYRHHGRTALADEYLGQIHQLEMGE